MYEWILSCKRAFRLFLRRIYVSKKASRERGLSRLHDCDVKPEGRSKRSCLTNLTLLSILVACYFFLVSSRTQKTSSYSEESIESSVVVNPKQVMPVNIPKEAKLELARKWLARNKPKIESVETGSLAIESSKNSTELTENSPGNLFVIDDDNRSELIESEDKDITTQPVKNIVELVKNAPAKVYIIDDNGTSVTTATLATVTLPPKCETRVSPEKLILNISVIKVSLDSIYPMVQKGGYYKPSDCVAVHKVAILVPYRNRTRNLTTFLYNIHPFLMTQNLEYQIFVIEQFGNNAFNKGRLFNAGFKEMKKFGSWRCVVLHDVDLLPLNRRIFYTCPRFPRHMSSAVIDKGSRRNASSPILFGGVTAMTVEQYEKANGHSNMYWGWGGEDYDMFWRIKAAMIPIVRYNKSIARYIALPHPRAPENPKRYILIRSAIDRWQGEGLNTIDYRVVSQTLRHLFTHIIIDVHPNADTNNMRSAVKASVKTEKGIVKNRRRDRLDAIPPVSMNQASIPKNQVDGPRTLFERKTT